jgi:phosphoribosyl 1,2-cyclic phosphate phosphodiesterase
MSDVLRITVLGCGSSGGVPRIGADGPNWGACDPANPRNLRRRCALLLQRIGAGGATSVLLDAGPDLREQLIVAGVGFLDAVVLTHDHADHVHGIDDLRMVVFNRRKRLPCWMDARTEATMMRRFGYVFETPPGSNYPPILDSYRIDGPVHIEGRGGVLTCTPFEVPHGEIRALGFRVGPLVYTPDISDMSDAAWAALQGAECWLLDALRHRPHPSHVNVEGALEWIARAALPVAYLTNLHVDLDYAALEAQTPPNVHPAHDGLVFEYPI